MNAYENVEIFEDTKRLCEKNEQLKASVAESVKGQKLIPESEKLSGGRLSFPPTVNFPQIKFGSVSILSLSTCCILRHVFICPLDQIHIFLYSLIV